MARLLIPARLLIHKPRPRRIWSYIDARMYRRLRDEGKFGRVVMWRPPRRSETAAHIK
jgi:hypothetical protein